MKVHQHVALRRLPTDARKIVDHDLIAALHEVHLDALHSPLLKLIECRNQLIIQRLPRRPQNEADVLLLRVIDQLLHVQVRSHFQQIPQLVPAVIQDDVRNPVFRREVNVVLIGFRVDARLKIHSIDVPIIPPIPGHFPRLDPRSVLNFRRPLQQIHDIVGQQISIVISNAKHSPGKSSSSRGLSNVVGGLHRLVVAVAGLHQLQGILRKSCRQSIAARSSQPQPGIVVQV